MRTLATSRLFGRLAVIWWVAVLAIWSGQQSWAAGPARTLVSDTVYRADGSTAKGTLLISWPAFATVSGEVVAAGSMSVQLGANGAVSVALIPNTGSTPKTSYRVTLKLDDGTTSEEYWTVPSATTVGIAAIRSTIAPAAVAQQYVGRDYVDTKLAQLGAGGTDQNAIHKSGDETVAGVKQFQTPPQVPAPQGASDAAPKSYVDAALGSAAQTSRTNTFAQPQTFSNGIAISGIFLSADAVSGSSPSAQIDNACAALGGNAGTVQIPSNFDLYAWPLNPVPENCTIIDNRNGTHNTSGGFDTKGNTPTGPTYYKRFSSTSAGFMNIGRYTIASEFVGPGKNSSNGPKDDMTGLLVQTLSRRAGQQENFEFSHRCNSDGDCIGEGGGLLTIGGNREGGGESAWLYDGFAMTASDLFTGTVSARSGNSVTFTSFTNPQSLGEDRYLIVPATAYNTGVISANNYPTIPWVLTGSGTTWSSMCPGGTAPCGVPSVITAVNCNGTQCTFTANNTFSAGDPIFINGLVNWTKANGYFFNVVSATATQFVVNFQIASYSGSETDPHAYVWPDINVYIDDVANLGTGGSLMKDVTKVATITDDTHLTLYYPAEGLMGNYPGGWPGVPTGTYTLYKGAVIVGAVNVPKSSGPITLTVNSATNLSNGTVVNEVAANNQAIGAIQIHLGQKFPGPGILANGFGGAGDGVRIDTAYGGAPAGNGFTARGAFTAGFTTGFSGTYSHTCALCVSSGTQVPTWLVDAYLGTAPASSYGLFRVKNSTNAQITLAYDIVNNGFAFPGGRIMDNGTIVAGAGVGPGNNAFYGQYNDATRGGVSVLALTDLNNGVPLISLSGAGGKTVFRVIGKGSPNYEMDLAQGTPFNLYSDNFATNTISLTSATGVVNATGGYKVNGTQILPLVASKAIVGTNASGQIIDATSTALPAAMEPAHTGDVTNTAGSLAMTLATVNAGPGTCGDATHICQVTTNGKGLVTAQSAVAITGGGMSDPGANGIVKRTALNTTAAATADDVSLARVCLASGSANVYTCSTSPTFTPATGDQIVLKVNVANTGTSTLAVNGASAANITKFGGGSTLEANDLLAGHWISATYDGATWQLEGMLGTTTGTGAMARANSPVFTTPTLGAATATTINKVTVTQPASSATLTIVDGKTAKVDNTLEFAGTDSTKMTFPSTNATVARTDAAQTFTGTQTFSGQITSTNAGTASAPQIVLSGTNNGLYYSSGIQMDVGGASIVGVGANGLATAASKYSQAEWFAGVTAVTTVTAGAAAGTSPTVTTCVASHVCDSFSGQSSVVAGTSPTTGTLLTITLPGTRTNQPNCVVGVSSANTTYLAPTWTTSTTQLVVSVGVAPTASATYYVNWVCGGK